MEERIIAELQALFAGESSGHDLFHTLRVTRTAQRIASQLPCDRELVTLGALLHDADDPKLFATQDYANARRILAGLRRAAGTDRSGDRHHPHGVLQGHGFGAPRQP